MNIVDECVLAADFEKVCRICMKFDKKFLAINSFNIIEMITACASVQIWENDDLPNQICNECFLQLQNTINFKHLCENSDKAFRQIIGNNKINLWNNKNDLCSIKNEEDSSQGFGNDNYPVYIKEEDNSNQNEDEKTLEIKKEEENRRETRKKNIQYKFEEDSDNSEDIKEQNDSDWESEDEKSDFEETQVKELAEFKCETCSGTFKRLDSLGQHMQRKHNAEGTKCKKCSVICYHPLHLRAHEKLHNKCRICNLSFSTRKKLESHKVTHVDKRIPEITCKMCEKQFTSRTNLNKHLREIHKIETKEILKCETCNETFKTKQILEIHTRKMHPKPKKINRSREIINCEVCGKMCQRRYLRAHMNIHGERNRIACEYCAKIFISQDTLQTHVKTYHIGSGPICRYLCTECGLKLRSKHQLNNHLITHTKERPFACDKCDKTYRTTCMLKVHISRTHLNERNFVCTFCSQAFFDKKILLNHVRRHTGEKPYKCDLCDKSFIQRVALQGHMKIHSV